MRQAARRRTQAPRRLAGGKHPKNKLYVGGTPPKKRRHPRAKVAL
ncbi:MAG TPA: hypothetical protein VE325_10740 [Burkholderiales bacterium]|jgi:hypothetical protein|nr:hypothetical protein [Burkholderiales bacterium]